MDSRNHDLRNVDGGTIILPPYIGGEKGWGNLEQPIPYIATTKQKYPRGTIFRKGDKSWVYSKLYTSTGDYGAYSAGKGLFSVAQDSASLTIATAAIGEYTVTVTDTLTVNAYAGGLLTIFEAGQPICCLGILSNTATVITLDGPLPGTYSASCTNIHVIPSPYHDVVMPGLSCLAGAVHDYCPGIFNSPLDDDGNRAAAEDFVWLQCWGLCFMWASGTYEGSVGGERAAVMFGDGAAQVLSDALIEEKASFQRIGYLFPGTGDVTVGNNPSLTDGTDPSLAQNVIYLTIRKI